jgi:hypothetical protein
LEEDDAVAFGDAAFAPLSFARAAGFDRAGALLFADRFAARPGLRDGFAGLDFDLLLAIWLSIYVSDSIECCHRHGPADVLAGRTEGVTEG